MRYALVVWMLLALTATHAEAGRGAASLKYLPDDTSVIIVGDVARARGSQMFSKLFQLARDNHAWLDTLAAAQPVEKQIDTMVIGGNDAKQTVVIFEGRFEKLLAEAKKTSTKSEKHAGITYWVTADGELAVIDKKLVFASAGLMPAVIDRAKNKKAKGPASVRTLLPATAGNTAVFGGALLDADVKSELKGTLGSEPQWATFAFTMTQTLTIDARLKFSDDASAASATKTINDQLTPERRGQLESFVGKEFSDSLTVDQQQSFARIAATLTPDELDKVIAFMKLLL